MKLSTLENPTFTFDLTQIPEVTFQCKHIFFVDHKVINYGFKMTLKTVGFC